MHFPPYQLLDSEHVAAAQDKFDRLQRLYHVGQTQAWDGKKVLSDLLRKHGGIKIPDEQREAIGHVFSVILWGELAAWTISADLALMIDDVEAKMAATSQAFDEARHFYVLRDYLLELGIRLPPLDGFTQVVLQDLLASHRLVDKLLGMQLIVENIALTLFRSVAQTGIEPVLCELMPYYERDEARHVGLGVLYLPHLLRSASRLENARLQLLQLKIFTLVGWASHTKQRHFKVLHIDPNASMRRSLKLQKEAFLGMRMRDGGLPPAVLAGSQAIDWINQRAIDFFFPAPTDELPRWQEGMVALCQSLASAGDAVLRRTAA